MSEKMGYLLLKYPQYLWKHAIEKKKSSKIIQNLFCAVEYDDFWNKTDIASFKCHKIVQYLFCIMLSIVQLWLWFTQAR